MKLPSSWTTVTPLSKTIAMIIFIILPILGFYFGLAYQQKIDRPLLSAAAPIQVMEKIVYQPLIDTKGWKTYTNNTIGMTLKYPASWTVKLKHSLSNRDVDIPTEINTAVIAGKEGELVLEWGPMGFGGGCDNWKEITVDQKIQEICSSPYENGSEIWSPITNGAQGEKANSMRALIKPPLNLNRPLLFTIFSTINYY